ncbi:hypothetical protein ABX014_19620 [Snodgrassella alvi]|uniref:hypothetical protein n=1 Tax=Snodgrassella alvi TaxID=1196083 RepID=UPI00351C01FB
METNRQTVILFRTINTDFTYETLNDYILDSKAGNILEAVEYNIFRKFPHSAIDIINESDRYLNEELGCIEINDFYASSITIEEIELLQKVLDLIAKNHNNDNLLINERTIHVPIAILPKDIDYFNSNKELSNRLKEWLSEVKKISQNLSR